MNALLIPVLFMLMAISVAVCAWVGRSIWREMDDAPGDAQDETRSERRTEESKNARIKKEIEQWRNGA